VIFHPKLLVHQAGYSHPTVGPLSKKSLLRKVSIRCGIHSGWVSVGNLGFHSRLKFGVIGLSAMSLMWRIHHDWNHLPWGSHWFSTSILVTTLG
jgi:hypothetical protein